MTKYKAYFLHDPVGNYEGQITDFDKEVIQKAIDNGLIVIGVTRDGNREIVKSVDDVVDPKIALMNSFPIVLPSYVDSKVNELTNVVEKLVNNIDSSSIDPLVLGEIKDSINKIHEDTSKTIESDKQIMESSQVFEKSEEM